MNKKKILKYKFLKKYKVDIWHNVVKINNSSNKMLNLFYKLIISKKRLKKKKIYNISKFRYKNLLTLKQIFKLYYLNLNNKQLLNLWNKSKSFKNNLFLNFFWLLEARLDMILWRLNWFKSKNELRQIINHKKILINNKICNKYNFVVKQKSFIKIKDRKIKFKVWFNLKQFLKLNQIIIKTPSYIEYNNKILIATLSYYPRFKEIPYPLKFDPIQILNFLK